MNITKMHGLGNDFIITQETMEDYSKTAEKLCTRRLSVGADGFMAVEKSDVADVKMRFYNADGSEAAMCGNGIRCFARYVYDHKIVEKEQMEIETLAGIMRPTLTIENGEVTGVCVDMGLPDYNPEHIPVLVDHPLSYSAEIDGETLTLSSVLMGVPHTVLFEKRSEADILRLGKRLESHALYPEKTNVNFAHVLDRHTIWVRTFERGAGRTLACGTGCSAVATIAHKKDLTDSQVTIQLETGELFIETMDNGHVQMTGPAAYVFQGETLA